jgi:DNA repair protein RecN (Recombination protein N)
MLTDLHIENFAIINSLDLSFTSGLVTFTGETGAGKSIILDAIQAILGGRTDVTQVRSGAQRAMVEASFQIPDASREAVVAILTREDLLDDENNLSLGREVRREGRSVARVNGRSVNLSLLRELGSLLVDIHGQSEHLSLLDVRQHIDLLDRYTGNDGLLSAYHHTYQQLTAMRRELKALRQAEQDALQRQDLLTFQVQEITSAHIKPGEEGDLRRERDRLANAEHLADLTRETLVLLDEGTSEAPSLSELLGRVSAALGTLSRIDASQEPLSALTEEIAENLTEIGRELQNYQEGLEFNPRRLEQVEERLDLLHNLKRKYGGSIESVLVFEADARKKLDTIANAGERSAALEEQEGSLLATLAGQGTELSHRRRQAANQLAEAIEGELSDLNMSGARFQVDLHIQPDANGVLLPDGSRVAFDHNGIDKVEFLIAPNPGEGFKPLVKIASGGETSRLMLALKNVLARADVIPTLIFDEIDQGIGGRVGTVVGEKLWQLGRRHQVFCVTHLPQLAAFGDQHFRVRKQVEDGRTSTLVDRLADEARLDELALMLGGVSEANRTAARETLTQARSRSAELTG